MNVKRTLCLFLAALALGVSIVGCGSSDGSDDASTAAAMNSRNAQRGAGPGGAPPKGGAPAGAAPAASTTTTGG